LDIKHFSRKEIIELYFRRWEIESYYRDEKIFIDVDTFHSRTVNGILQELFAALIMSVIARILMVISISQPKENKTEARSKKNIKKTTKTMPEPQFKNSVMALAAEAAILAPDKPKVAAAIFNEILEEIRRVKYYRPKIPQQSKARFTKRPNNKWAGHNPKVWKKKECKA
jgi:hypothetical protein